MRKGEKYRFSLAWRRNTAERIAVGELLETLSNRKSDLVVQAVWEFIQRHPELMERESKVVIKVHSTPPDEQVFARIQSMIEASVKKQIAGINQIEVCQDEGKRPDEPSEMDLDDMLANLDVFDQQP